MNISIFFFPMLIAWGLWVSLPWLWLPVLLFFVILAIFSFYPFSCYLPGVRFRGKKGEKGVLLTFDDGPVPHTQDILETLRRKQVKAVFFLIGERVPQHLGLVEQMLADGHLIGNHTRSHKSYLFPFLSLKKMMDEIESWYNIVPDCIPDKPAFFRPPVGIISPPLQFRLLMPVYNRNLKVLLWNIRSLDTIHGPHKAKIRVLKQLSPGSIILLHDHIKNDIAGLIDLIREKNYKIADPAEFLQGLF